MTESEFKKTILDNGIRLVTERIPSVRSVSIGVWLTVGSSNESKRTNGISHFIEHMMFKGTQKREAVDIATSLESVGGHLNAFTGREVTCYYAHILDEHLPTAVEILADILINSVFDPSEIEKEKKVIIEELNALEETPEERIHDLFVSDLFPDHPLGLSVIGSRENIRRFKREDLFEYVHKHYTTDRMVVAAAGNVVHEELLGLVERYFRDLDRAGTSQKVVPTHPVHGHNIVEDGSIQAHICLGTQSYSYRDQRKFGLLVLNTLLGSGMSSRLFQNVREKHGLAYSIYSYIDFFCHTGMFGVYVGTDQNKIDSSLDLINAELRRLTREPVPEAELERTKSQLKGNLMLGLESTSSRMNRLAKMEIYLNKYFTLDDTLTEIDRVTQDDVLNVANELFQEERLFTTVLKPKAKMREETTHDYRSPQGN